VLNRRAARPRSPMPGSPQGAFHECPDAPHRFVRPARDGMHDAGVTADVSFA
jgi:hypothetical protein